MIVAPAVLFIWYFCALAATALDRSEMIDNVIDLLDKGDSSKAEELFGKLMKVSMVTHFWYRFTFRNPRRLYNTSHT